MESPQNTSEKGEPTPKKTVLDVALVWLMANAGIPIVTAACYYGIFQYELGYCRAFDVPGTIIQPSIPHFVAFAGVAILLVANFHHLAVAPSPFRNLEAHPEKGSVIGRLLQLHLLLPIVILPTLYASTRPSPIPTILVSILFAMLGGFDLVQARYGKGREGWASRLVGPIKVLPIMFRERSRVVMIGFLAFYLSLIIQSVGNAHGVRETEFYISSEFPNAVVVRIYGDRAILANVDAKHERLTGGIFVVSTDREKIGELTRVKMKPLGKIYVPGNV